MKLKYKFTLLIPFLIYTQVVFSQVDSSASINKNIWASEKHYFFSGGIVYDGHTYGDIGIVYGITNTTRMIEPSLAGYRFGSEFMFDNEKFIMGPKVSAELDVLIIGGRINIIDYTDFTYHDVKLTPEIGFTVDGAVDLFYGYNITLTNSEIKKVGEHRISLIINFDKEYWKFLN
jgi:hypothetical protein